jgi:hypothetical protein
MFYQGLVIGMFIGAFLGVILLAILIAGRNHEPGDRPDMGRDRRNP